MGNEMKHIMAIVIALSSCGVARAIRSLGDICIAGDSERFYAYRARVGGLLNYSSYLDYRGIAVQNTHYSQADWSRDAQALIGVWRQQDRTTLAGINAEGGVVRIAGHTRVVGDAAWNVRPRPTTAFGFIAAGDLVETQAAIERGVAYGFFGVSVEQELVSRLTAIDWSPTSPLRMVTNGLICEPVLLGRHSGLRHYCAVTLEAISLERGRRRAGVLRSRTIPSMASRHRNA